MGDFNIGLGVRVTSNQQEIQSQINAKSKNVEVNADVKLNTQTIKKQTKEISAELKEAFTLKQANLDQNVSTYLSKNKKLTSDLREEFIKLQSSIKTSSNPQQLSNLSKELSTLKSKASELGQTGDTVFGKFKSDIGNFMTFVVGGGFVMGAINSIRTVIENVTDLDTAVTGLYKVTNNTTSEYQAYFKQAAVSAKNYGATITDIVNSTTDWARLHYSLPDADKLAEVATMYKNVGDIDIGTATSDLVTAMKGFSKELNGTFSTGADKAEHVANIYNELGNNYAITSAQVGTGISNAASALATANNTLEQSASMVTAITEVTQDASEAGNSLKVTSMRLRGATASELEAIGEDTDGLTDSISSLRDKIKGLSGVDIMLDDNTFKSTYQIMQEISKVYDKLSDTSKANLLQTIAGKQRGNQVAALLSNFTTAENALTSAMNSQNSASSENEKYLNSIEGKAKKFQAEIQALSSDILDSGVIKFFVDLGTTGVSALDDVTSTLGSIPALILAIGTAIGTVKGIGALKDVIGFQSKKDILKDISETLNTKAETVAETENTVAENANSASKDLNTEKRAVNSATTVEETATTVANTTATTENAVAQSKLGTIFSSVGTKIKSFLSTPIGFAGAVVGVLASMYAVYKGIDYVSKVFDGTINIEKQKAKVESLKKVYDDANNTLTDTTNELQNTSNKIKDLEDAKSNGTISLVQEAELTKLKETQKILKENQKLYQQNLDNANKELIKQSEKSFNAEFGNSNIDDMANSQIKSSGSIGNIVSKYDSKNDGTQYLVEAIINTNKQLQDAITSGDQDTVNDLTESKQYLVDELTKKSTDTLTALNNYKANLIKGMNADGTFDNSSDQEVYNRIVEWEKQIYKALGQGAQFNTDQFSNLISDDTFKTSIDKLKVDISNGVDTSDLSKYSDLNNVLQKTNLILEDGQTPSSLFIQYLKSIATNTNSATASTNSYKDALEDINKKFSSLTDNANLVSSVNKQISDTGKISIDNLQKMLTAYPKLAEALYNYETGLISEQDLFAQLSKAYDDDQTKYIKTLISKDETSQQFFNAIKTNYPELFNQLASVYGDDVNNWKTMAEAENEITNNLIATLKQNWGDYFSVIGNAQSGFILASQNFDDSDLALTNSGEAEVINARLDAQKAQAQALVDGANKAAESLRGTAYDYISSNIDTSWQGLSGDNSESASKSAKDYDMIATALDRLSRSYTNLKNVADDTSRSFEERNLALVQSAQNVTDQINLQQQAYQKYMDLANSVGLDGGIADMIRNGSISMFSTSDEDLQSQIDKFQTYYESALKCSDSVQTLTESLSDIAKSNFDMIMNRYENQISSITHATTTFTKELDQLKEQGNMASTYAYDELINIEQANINKLQQERNALIQALNVEVSNGKIEQYSEQWYDMQGNINNVTESIQDATKSLTEYKNELRQISWDAFDYTRESVSSLVDETEFLTNLLSNSSLTDESGTLNNNGLAVQGIHVANYDIYTNQAKAYADEIKKINAEIANDPYNTTLVDRRKELLKLQQESINSAQDEKNAIKDLLQDAYDKQLDSINKAIDKYKELMDTIKNAYDYQKNIAEQTAKLAELQKQQLMGSGDTSEEGKKNAQELKTNISEAQANLKDTEYQQMITDTEKILDDLSSDAEQLFNERLDNIDGLLQQAIDSTNQNASIISSTIASATSSIGYTLSSTMSSIWTNVSGSITNVGNTITNVIGNISNMVSQMLANSNAQAQATAQSLVDQQASQGASSDYSYVDTGDSGDSGNSDSGSGGGSYDDVFEYSPDYYPKDQLNIDTSIVD